MRVIASFDQTYRGDVSGMIWNIEDHYPLLCEISVVGVDVAALDLQRLYGRFGFVATETGFTCKPTGQNP